MVSRSEIVVELRRNGPFRFAGLHVYQLFPAQIVSSIVSWRAGLLQILGRARQWQTLARLVAAHLDDRRLRGRDHWPRIYNQQALGCF